jgi:outer membrane protein
MKRYIILTFFIVMLSASVFGQRLAYVDSEYVLRHIPEYSSAQKQLDALADQWQREIETKFAEAVKLSKDYQADKVLLTDDMKKKRESDINQKEKEANELQQLRFGFEGDLYKQKVRLIKPIQDRVAKSIEEYAVRENIDLVLDKNSVTLLYARANFDSTNDVITRMGFKPGSFAK